MYSIFVRFYLYLLFFLEFMLQICNVIKKKLFQVSLHYVLSKLYPALVNPKLRHYFHFVHRLDFVTSGVLCLALNKKAATAAAKCFEMRFAKKYYIALVRGHVSLEMIDVTAAIGKIFTTDHWQSGKGFLTRGLVC